MKIVYLIDGSNVIHRGHSAMERHPLMNKAGEVTSGLVHLWGVVRECVSHSLHVAVTFDEYKKTKLKRLKIDPAYKANRISKTAEEKDKSRQVKVQVNYARKLCEAAGIPVFSSLRYEADDLLSALALTCAAEHSVASPIAVRIITYDKDLTQLVTSQIKIYDTKLRLLYDAEKVKEKFGVAPSQIAAYLALCGDRIDGIPNIYGIGPDTAKDLLVKWRSIAGIYDNLVEIPKACASRLKRGKKQVERNLKLTRLYRTVSHEPEITGLESVKLQRPDRVALQQAYTVVDFHSKHLRWR